MTASKKTYFLGALAFCLLPAFNKAVCLSLDPIEPILIAREPGDIALEHALLQYHHYYPTSCDVKFFDLALAPFYKFFWVGNSGLEFESIGTLIQAQFNMGDLWIRVNALAGRLTQRLQLPKDAQQEDLETFDPQEREVTGVDDVLIRLGYDFFYNGDDHTGIYLRGGIPFDRKPRADLDKGTIIIKDPVLTLGNFRIGAGTNGAWTVYDCNDHHATVHFDLQYRYAFRTVLAFLEAGFKENHDATQQENSKTDLCFTPGHFIAAWFAGHYAWHGCQVEAGIVLSGGFGEHASIVTETAISTSSVPKKSAEKNDVTDSSNVDFSQLKDFSQTGFPQPRIVEFQAQPYIAAAYSSVCWDAPYTAGCGISFDIDKLSQNREHNMLYGVTAWFTLTMSI